MIGKAVLVSWLGLVSALSPQFEGSPGICIVLPVRSLERVTTILAQKAHTLRAPTKTVCLDLQAFIGEEWSCGLGLVC